MEERADGGGLQVQEKSLGWGSLLAGSGQARRRRREGTRGWWGDQGGQEGYKRRDADITARLAALGRGNSLEAGAQMNTYFSNGLRRGMSALSAGGKGIGGYEVIAKIGQQLAPDVMSRLSSYVPLAIGEQEQLTDAISRRKRNLASGIEANLSANSRRFPRKSQLQYGLKLEDEYDTLPQARYRLFHKQDAPELKCSGDGETKTDRLDDCKIPEGKEYNRMFYLDRRRSNVRASAQQVHRRMNGVKQLASEWKHLLIGQGGGSGPGAFDSPYYWCYDQFQEDPELSTCLRQLALKKGGGEEAWAKQTSVPDEDLRRGFPKLRKEWEEELGDEGGEGMGK